MGTNQGRRRHSYCTASLPLRALGRQEPSGPSGAQSWYSNGAHAGGSGSGSARKAGRSYQGRRRRSNGACRRRQQQNGAVTSKQAGRQVATTAHRCDRVEPRTQSSSDDGVRCHGWHWRSTHGVSCTIKQYRPSSSLVGLLLDSI